MTPVNAPPARRGRCRGQQRHLATSRRCNLYTPEQMDAISVKSLETGVLTQRQFLDFAYSGFVYQRAYFKLIDELACSRGQVEAVALGATAFAEVQREIDWLLQSRADARLAVKGATLEP